MGDAILAFFGAPIAHEDDPQRAVLAGLEIIEGFAPYREEVKSKWGLDFDVRIGINTGLVVVGEVGSDLRVEYTALGDAINLAARMEQTAQPGTVQISGDTHRLIAPLFEFESLGGIEVKGKAEPVQAYQVIRSKAEPGRMRGIEGLDSPLIGRDGEIKALKDMIDQLLRGNGQIASVMGEAGLGKSRLIAEFRGKLAADGKLSDSGFPSDGNSRSTVIWWEGRSLSYQTSMPCAPFVDLFTRLFGIRSEQAESEKYGSLKAQIEGIVSEDVAEISPFLATMLGINPSDEDNELVKYLSPPQLRDKIFRATRDLFGRIAEQQPLVVMFEDLHWIDPTSLELIEQLLPLTDRADLMIICAFRPWRQDPSWRFHELATRDYAPRYSSVVLEPLDESKSNELIASLLAVEDLPAKVQSLIFAKSEGNPFFLEEVIRSLLEADLIVQEDSRWRVTGEIENISVPDTLTGVITARLDRLDEEGKRAIQTASVLGREFHFDTLASVHETTDDLDETLRDLQRRELIREKSRRPERAYMFKHVLTQETAYSSLLMSTRRDLHGKVAEYLEQVSPDRVNDIARHFNEALQEARALPYFVEAGSRANRAYSAPEAIGNFTRSLEILSDVKDAELARRAYEGMGEALILGNDIAGAVKNFHAMFHSAQEYDDIPMQVSALNKLGFITALRMGEYPEAERHLLDAERLARKSDDIQGLAEMHMTFCFLRVPFGEFDQAVEHLKEAAEIGRRMELEEPRLFGLVHIANTLTYMTHYDQAWAAIEEAQNIAESLGNRHWQSEILALTKPLHHLRAGDIDEANRSAKQGAELAAQIGAADDEFHGTYMQGQISWLRGDYEAAIRFQQHALQAANTSGLAYPQVAALCALGTIHLDISVAEFAEQTADLYEQALRLMEEPLGKVAAGAIWAEMGFSHLALGDLDRAGELFRQGLSVSTAVKFLARPFLLVGSAIVDLSRGNLEDASLSMVEAREFVEEREMKNIYPLVSFADANISAASGKPEEALRHFEVGEELAMKAQMRPSIWQLHLGTAGALSSLGREEESETKRHEARKMVDEIADLFQDGNLRKLYIENVEGKFV